MNKRATSDLSKSFTGATIEVSKRGQHLLSQMRASHSSLRYRLQSWQSPHYGLGKPSPGEAEARLWRPEIPRTKANCQTTKKSLVRLKCRTCNYTLMRLGIRLRKLEVGA